MALAMASLSWLRAASASARRSGVCYSTTAVSAFSWERDVEREAMGAAQNKKMDWSGLSPNDVMMDKVSREFAAEGVSLAKSQEDKLTVVLRKMATVSGNKTTYNALRKKALGLRQDVITQRDAAGLSSKDQDEGRKLIEELFPIGGPL
jgi:hypothetical protein